jgi:hypothetical protein
MTPHFDGNHDMCAKADASMSKSDVKVRVRDWSHENAGIGESLAAVQTQHTAIKYKYEVKNRTRPWV